MERVLPGSGLVAQALRLGTSIGAGLVVLAAAASVAGVEEFSDATATGRAQVQKLLRRRT
jgi:hypothetical protein